MFPGGAWDDIRTANPGLFERAAQLSSLGRHGSPEEVADVVAFLASRGPPTSLARTCASTAAP
jgi:NAD(P)-dependent dehydrogenase (short-subunit alcohol dehydrogenase family)